MKWTDAFEQKGEVECEALGAVHLLMHGIWAYKTSATGERTDLVLGTHLVVDERVVESAQGLVLTEWKLVGKNLAPDAQARAAKSQAARYAEGILAGFELKSDRYLVLVGKDEFTAPADEIVDGIRYKVIPIILNRKPPSKTKATK